MIHPSRVFGSRRRGVATAALVVLTFAIGCKEKSSTTTTTVDAAQPSTPSTATASADASVPKRETVNLVYFTPSRVWVLAPPRKDAKKREIRPTGEVVYT